MVRSRNGPVSDLMDAIDPSHDFGQLVLARRKNGSLVISDSETGEVIAVISVNAISDDGYKTSIGCHAPISVSVDRESIYLLKRSQQSECDASQKEEIEKWLKMYGHK